MCLFLTFRRHNCVECLNKSQKFPGYSSSFASYDQCINYNCMYVKWDSMNSQIVTVAIDSLQSWIFLNRCFIKVETIVIHRIIVCCIESLNHFIFLIFSRNQLIRNNFEKSCKFCLLLLKGYSKSSFLKLDLNISKNLKWL